MEENNLKELKNLFKVTFGKDYNAIHMYFLKHLGRYNKVFMDIPRWVNNGWEDNLKLKFQEVPKGSYFKREFLEQMGVKNEEDLKRKFTIYYEMFDKNVGLYVAKGFFEERSEAFDFYIEQMKKAKNLQERLIGVVPHNHNYSNEPLKGCVSDE